MKNKICFVRKFIPAVFIISLFVSAAAPVRLSAGTALDELGAGTASSGLSSRLSEALPSPAPQAEQAQQLSIFDKPSDRIYYILPSQVDASQMGPAPADGSATDIEDMNAVRRWQTERTEAQCAAANAQSNATYDEFFGAVSPFASPAAGEVGKILDKVRTDAGSIVYVQKEQYKRPRPFQRDPALNPCLGRESGYSYPSGHAATARVFGLILAELVPADSGKFMAYADQAALNRVIGGVHHPSDIEAGKKLGDAIYKALKKNNNFNKDMTTLRKNLKR